MSSEKSIFLNVRLFTFCDLTPITAAFRSVVQVPPPAMETDFPGWSANTLIECLVMTSSVVLSACWFLSDPIIPEGVANVSETSRKNGKPGAFPEFCNWLHKKGFYVQLSEKRAALKATLSYVGRYALRPPLSEVRICWVDMRMAMPAPAVGRINGGSKQEIGGYVGYATRRPTATSGIALKNDPPK